MPLSIDIYGYMMVAGLGIILLVNLAKKAFSHKGS
jgi:hypothetical protein